MDVGDNVEVGDGTVDVIGKALLPVGKAFGAVGRAVNSDKSVKENSPRVFVSLLNRVMTIHVASSEEWWQMKGW